MKAVRTNWSGVAKWVRSVLLRSPLRLAILVAGLALLGAFVFGGAFSADLLPRTETTTPPSGEAQAQPAPAASDEGSFLPEYDPAARWDTEPGAQEETGWGMAVGLFAKLGVVLAAIYATAWGAKRFRQWTQPALTDGQTIRVLETAYLAPQRALHLIEVRGHSFLIGASDQNMALITALPATAETVSTSAGQAGRPADPPAILSPGMAPEANTRTENDRDFNRLLSDVETRVVMIRQQIEQRQRGESSRASSDRLARR